VLPSALEEAFMVAVSRRPGPVLIDIPMDIQRADVDATPQSAIHPLWPSRIPNRLVTQLVEAVLNAKRPIILAGGGLRVSNTVEAFRRFIDTAQIPVVHSLLGVDSLPSQHPLNAGMIGSYGNRWANLTLSQSDCLIVLGSRLDVRQTGADTAGFKGERPIFHIDCDEAEVNNRIINCTPIISDLGTALEVLTGALQPHGKTLARNTKDWRAHIASLRAQWPDTAELKDQPGINPNLFMHQLSAAFPTAAAYVADVGQHQMWAAQSLDLGPEQRFLTSGGMGSMGFALPAAIGAAVAAPQKPIVVIAGDGGFQCNIQELQTVRQLNLPLKIVVINNECHGMVRQFQESYFEGRYQSTVWGYSAPNFEHISNAYGIPAFTVDDPSKIERALALFAEDANGPSLLQVMVPSTTNALPKLAFGRGMDSMEPFVKPLDMEGT
jgi:acetolactate synthase-1/2/3 large subunit